MFSNKVQAIILAAGKSTRFNTGRTKLLEKICGQEMILYTTRLLERLNIPTTIVIGYQKDAIAAAVTKVHLNTVNFIVQPEQKGTGHALACTHKVWERDHILILNGDVPLVTADIIESLFEIHTQKNADISFVIAHNADPSISGYGRIIKTDTSVSIVEAQNFKGDASEHCCVNAGIYLVRKSFLQSAIKELTESQNAEVSITDLVAIAAHNHKNVETISAPFDIIRGINTLQELWAAEQIKRSELIKYWMDKGVHFSVAHNVHIDLDVQIGSGSYIGCGTHLLKGSAIGKNCTIQEFSSIENTHLGDNCNILPHCIIKDSVIADHVQIGPFAHIREQTQIGSYTKIGNFVEIKSSILGKNIKAKHVTYLANAHLGSDVTIGAGTMTCTHTNSANHQTTIGDNVYIGANCTLVAPVTIERDAYTASGSVITEDVPKASLAIARARQINKDEYSHQMHDVKVPEKVIAQHSAIKSFLGALKTKNQNSDLS